MRFCDVDWYAQASRPSSSPRVSFVAFPRPHAPGHKPTAVTGGFLAVRFVDAETTSIY